MDLNWGELVVGQLEFYWDAHLRPRLEGLTDEEYFWEPVDGCWNVRRDEDGRWKMDKAWPIPQPEPVTTIAWRMMHIAVELFSMRASAFFGDDSDGLGDDANMWDPRREPASMAGSAAEALAMLDESYRSWHDPIAALDPRGLAKPLGVRGADFAQSPMADLILHISRETMHHGGEIGVLRDLYRRGFSGRGA
jgi:hypothetical protein